MNMKNRGQNNIVKFALHFRNSMQDKSHLGNTRQSFHCFLLIWEKMHLGFRHSIVTIVFKTVGKDLRKTFVGINGMCLGFCGQNFWDSAETRFWLKTYMVFITL